MFGAALADSGPGDRPTVARQAGARARALLEDVIAGGVRSGVFAVASDHPKDHIVAAHVFWSAVHGLTMLVIDDLVAPDLSVDDMIETLLRTQIKGLRQA